MTMYAMPNQFPTTSIDQHRMSATTHDQDDDKYKAIVAELQKSIADRSVLMLLHPWCVVHMVLVAH